MENKIDFKQMTNAELNIKLSSYSNSYEKIKNNIVEEVKQLGELDKLYRQARDVLEERNSKSANNFITDTDDDIWKKLNINNVES